MGCLRRSGHLSESVGVAVGGRTFHRESMMLGRCEERGAAWVSSERECGVTAPAACGTVVVATVIARRRGTLGLAGTILVGGHGFADVCRDGFAFAAVGTGDGESARRHHEREEEQQQSDEAGGHRCLLIVRPVGGIVHQSGQRLSVSRLGPHSPLGISGRARFAQGDRREHRPRSLQLRLLPSPFPSASSQEPPPRPRLPRR